MTSNNARRRFQDGSIRPLVILVIIGALVWWQWDRIANLFGVGSFFGGGSAAEVVDYRCDPQSGGRLLIDGRVRNASDKPIAFKAVTAIYDQSDKRSDYAEATVRPFPLPPGEVGFFQTDGPPLPDGGSCRLDSIVDSDTGRAVHMTRVRR